MTKIHINQRKCIGCGTCTVVAPKTFRLGKNGKAEVINQKDSLTNVKAAIQSCPVEAISLKED